MSCAKAWVHIFMSCGGAAGGDIHIDNAQSTVHPRLGRSDNAFPTKWAKVWAAVGGGRVPQPFPCPSRRKTGDRPLFSAAPRPTAVVSMHRPAPDQIRSDRMSAYSLYGVRRGTHVRVPEQRSAFENTAAEVCSLTSPRYTPDITALHCTVHKPECKLLYTCTHVHLARRSHVHPLYPAIPAIPYSRTLMPALGRHVASSDVWVMSGSAARHPGFLPWCTDRKAVNRRWPLLRTDPLRRVGFVFVPFCAVGCVPGYCSLLHTIARNEQLGKVQVCRELYLYKSVEYSLAHGRSTPGRAQRTAHSTAATATGHGGSIQSTHETRRRKVTTARPFFVC